MVYIMLYDVRPCAQGRCGRCPLEFGVMSDLFCYFLLKICDDRQSNQTGWLSVQQVDQYVNSPVLSQSPRQTHIQELRRVTT